MKSITTLKENKFLRLRNYSQARRILKKDGKTGIQDIGLWIKNLTRTRRKGETIGTLGIVSTDNHSNESKTIVTKETVI